MLRALRREPVDRLPTQSNYTRAMGAIAGGAFRNRRGGVAGAPGKSSAARGHRLSSPHQCGWVDRVRLVGRGMGHPHGGLLACFLSARKTRSTWIAIRGPIRTKRRFSATAEQTILRDGANYFIAPNLGMCLFERAWSLRGFDALLMDMLERTEWVEDLLDRITGDSIALSQEIRRGRRRTAGISATTTARSAPCCSRRDCGAG